MIIKPSQIGIEKQLQDSDTIWVVEDSIFLLKQGGKENLINVFYYLYLTLRCSLTYFGKHANWLFGKFSRTRFRWHNSPDFKIIKVCNGLSVSKKSITSAELLKCNNVGMFWGQPRHFLFGVSIQATVGCHNFWTFGAEFFWIGRAPPLVNELAFVIVDNELVCNDGTEFGSIPVRISFVGLLLNITDVPILRDSKINVSTEDERARNWMLWVKLGISC